MDPLPDYDQLPVRPGAPPGSSWGVWGDADNLGALNLLTDERTLAAIGEVRRGAVFPLGLPLDQPNPGLHWRTPVEHHLLRVGHQQRDHAAGGTDDLSSGFADRDDYLERLWLQGSSQWDGLAHVRHREHGNYNGVPDADIHGGPDSRLGIDKWSRRGVVGRGVLLDLPAYYDVADIEYDPASGHEITVADVRNALAHQRVELKVGDIALLHTGWMQHYLDADLDRRHQIMAAASMTAPGLAPVPEMVEYLWNSHVAAIAADTASVEAVNGAGPLSGPKFYLHSQLLPLLGIVLGECFYFPDLLEDCRADGRYTFLLVSVPFNVPGAIGSPPQAVALK